MDIEQLNTYISAVSGLSNFTIERNFLPSELLLEKEGDLSIYYAPFDHINTAAKVAFIGLTPGLTQAKLAITSLKTALQSGDSMAISLQKAKLHASFGGAMRNNLISMLDSIGLHNMLGVNTTATLFEDNSPLAHFTSVLRYPVFLRESNYSGNPHPLKHPLLKSHIERYLVPELRKLSGTWLLPLGKQATDVVQWLAETGMIDGSRILDGLPHPSGANAERIAYFVGRKQRDNLSSKTNADTLDKQRATLLEKLRVG